MNPAIRLSLAGAAALAAAAAFTACGNEQASAPSATVGAAAGAVAPAVEETADEFVARLHGELDDVGIERAAAEWVRATYIIEDTGLLSAKAAERALAHLSATVEESKRFDGTEMSPESARIIAMLKRSAAMPAPNDPERRGELTRVQTEMEGMYGSGKYCPDGEDSCRNLTELSKVLAESRDYDEQLEAWVGWRTVSVPMRPLYQRFAELTGEGARDLGFANLAEMWQSGYDMSTTDFEAEVERLWGQVEPLYEQLHCHVRAELAETYGEDRVPLDGPIPAHLLGNMWSQQWAEIYDLIEPYPGVANLDVSGALVENGYDAEKMVRTAEAFFTSLGMRELPESFYERSMFTRPRDREVVCHASAWDMNPAESDVRIKQCIEPTEDQFTTVHHELGHIYYYLAYQHLPSLFRTGANDGFHEGIGDTLNLSMTPAYLEKLGLIDAAETSDEAVINQQMKLALDKIAFLPFGKLIDQWRWGVFTGDITPENYNAAWWELRTRYQGIAPPVQRSEADFDPGAKYHVPGNTPYTRYFLSHILQFQFHKALCEAGGHEGPLHECSIYESPEAGEKLWAMMQRGASQPWQDTLEEAIGSREMDGSAIIAYFQPLMTWLETRNEGRSCGW